MSILVIVAVFLILLIYYSFKIDKYSGKVDSISDAVSSFQKYTNWSLGYLFVFVKAFLIISLCLSIYMIYLHMAGVS